VQNIYGVSTIEKLGDSHEVAVCINLQEGFIEATMKDPVSEVFDVKNKVALLESVVVLKNTSFILADGSKIESELIDNVFIKQYKPAGLSIYDTKLNNMFNYVGGNVNVAHFKLVPRNKSIIFIINPQVENYEIVYLNNSAAYVDNFNFHNKERCINVKASDASVSFVSSSNINDIERKIWLSWSVLQGHPLTKRLTVGENRLAIYLESEKSFQTGFRLYKNTKDLPELFCKIFNFLENLEVNDFLKWEKALHFYIEGKASWTDIDIRAINFFILLEILDKSKTINKTTLSRMLKIDPDDADMICEVRNKLIHEEHYLKSAIEKAYAIKKEQYREFNPKEFKTEDSDSVDPKYFFINLIRLIDRYLIGLIGYSGEWNDQQKLIRQL
jgi:hypothetical protein